MQPNDVTASLSNRLAALPFPRIAPSHLPHHDGRGACLRDGTRVELRPLGAADRSAIEGLFRGLSPEARRLRFATPSPALEPGQLRFVLSADGDRHVAWGAFHHGRLVAVARYVRLGDEAAELAATVADAWQGRGLGRLLVETLAGVASARGIERFSCWVLADNRRACRLAASLGGRFRWHGGLGEAELALPARRPSGRRAEPAASRPVARRAARAALLLLALCTAPLLAVEQVVSVGGGCDYPSLQAALDAELGGPEVKVFRIKQVGLLQGPTVLDLEGQTGEVRIEGGYQECDAQAPTTGRTPLRGLFAGRTLLVIGPLDAPRVVLRQLAVQDGLLVDGGSSGGGLRVGVFQHVRLEEVTVLGNQAANGGGIAVDGFARLELGPGVIVHSNAAAPNGFGGGLYAFPSAHVVAEGGAAAEVLFANNSASAGGGMYLDGTAAVLSGITFDDNHAVGVGGGLRAKDSEVLVDDRFGRLSLFRRNDAERGSALGAAGADTLLVASGHGETPPAFFDNDATGRGTVEVENEAEVILVNPRFRLNRGDVGAVVVAFGGARVTLSRDRRSCVLTMDCAVVDNNRQVAAGSGTLFRVASDAELELDGMVVSRNDLGGDDLFHVGDFAADRPARLALLGSLLYGNTGRVGLVNLQEGELVLAATTIADNLPFHVVRGSSPAVEVHGSLVWEPGVPITVHPPATVDCLALADQPAPVPGTRVVTLAERPFATAPGAAGYRLDRGVPAQDLCPAPAVPAPGADLDGDAAGLDDPLVPNAGGSHDAGANEVRPPGVAPPPFLLFEDGFRDGTRRWSSTAE